MMPRMALLLGLLAWIGTAMYGTVGAVTRINNSQFKTLSKGIVLVKFYSPSCGHCHNFKSEYEKVGAQLRHIVRVAAVDATTENTGVSISGYPTVKLFIEGKAIDYDGPRQAGDLVGFVMNEVQKLINKRSGKSSSSSSSGSRSSSSGGSGSGGSDVVQLNDSNFEKLVLKSDEPWFVQFYAPWCGHCKSLAPQWQRLATTLKGEVKVGKVDATVQKSLASQYGVSGFPTLVWFPDGKKSGNHQTYQGGRTHDAMKDFAVQHVGVIRIKHLFNQEVYDTNCKDSHLCALGFIPNEEPAEQERLVDILQAAAKEFGNVKFAWTVAGEQPALASHFDVNDYPVLIIIAGVKGKFARMLRGFSETNVRDTINDVFGGKLRQWRPLNTVPKVKAVAQSSIGKDKKKKGGSGDL